ncbi:DUF1279 superfamily [Ceratocystis pirilliformis]|uniref:DUF1279 superfamily n=1 Tax=Ceratocystis pirilliformis TaxID=259994 RepID=A0ABR3YYB4_9PEZI
MYRTGLKLQTGSASRWPSIQGLATRLLPNRAFSNLHPQLRLATSNPNFPLMRSRSILRLNIRAGAKQSLHSVFRARFNSSSTSGKMREAAEKVKQKASEGKEQAQTLGQRLKILSKQYGWVALGVYLGLSMLDFPFCFLLVRVAGPERIGHLENVVVSAVSSVIPDSVKPFYHECKAKLKQRRTNEAEREGSEDGSNDGEVESKGASLGTQLALAYAIHKSLIFIRVPLTAAVTPKVVKILHRWGYKVGNKPSKG